jgi:hypothetical protein
MPATALAATINCESRAAAARGSSSSGFSNAPNSRGQGADLRVWIGQGVFQFGDGAHRAQIQSGAGADRLIVQGAASDMAVFASLSLPLR